MKKTQKIIILISIIFCCVSCDQFSKKIAKEYLENKAPIIFFHDLFRLQYAENNGAFLSLGSNLSDIFHLLFLRIIPLIILLTIFVFVIIKINELSRLKLISLSLILSGGFSNLLERFINNKLVIDFLNFGIGNIRTGILNIADLYIVIGMIFLFFSYYFERRRENN